MLIQNAKGSGVRANSGPDSSSASASCRTQYGLCRLGRVSSTVSVTEQFEGDFGLLESCPADRRRHGNGRVSSFRNGSVRRVRTSPYPRATTRRHHPGQEGRCLQRMRQDVKRRTGGRTHSPRRRRRGESRARPRIRDQSPNRLPIPSTRSQLERAAPSNRPDKY